MGTVVASAGTENVSRLVAETVHTCPLTTQQIVDLAIEEIRQYNAKWMQLYGYQIEFITRILWSMLDHDGQTITALWARQSGKSSCLAAMAPVLCLLLPALAKAFPGDDRLDQYANGVWIGIFAPVEEKTKFIFDPLHEHAEDPDIKDQFYCVEAGFGVKPSDPAVSRGDRVAWSNGSRVVCRTASLQSNKEGDTFHLVIIDEAQLLSEYKKQKEINPMMKSTKGTLVEIGTADIQRGGFFNDITYNIAQEAKTGKRNHFEFPWDKVCAHKQVAFLETGKKFHTFYEDSVRLELEKDFRGNQDAPAFRLNYRLLWQTANLGAVDIVAFDNCARRDRELNEPRYWFRQVAGVDLGKSRDCTVLTVVEIDPQVIYEDLYTAGMRDDVRKEYHQKCIIAWYEIRGRKWRHIVGEIARLLANHVVDTLVCDATGVGDPVTEMIEDRMPYLRERIIPFQMSAKGNDTVYKIYLPEIEAERMGYAAGDLSRGTAEYCEYVRQHEILQRKKVGDGMLVKCEAPDGDHDDYVDSAALACYAASLPPPEVMEQAANPSWQGQQAGLFWSRDARGSREDRYREGRNR